MLILNHLEPSQSSFVLKLYVYTFILILLCKCVNSQFYLKTIAGTGTSSDTGDNGPATLATINLPNGIWGDSIGNIYFGEDTGNRVRKISISGIISTFVGTGGSYDAGGLGGPALTVNLDAVCGVYGDDKNSSLYFSGGIFFIWRYDFATGNVTRIGGDITFGSGQGTQGFGGDGGPATQAFFFSPTEIYLSSVGILYIADSFNNRVRFINTSSGIIDTFAGSGECCRRGGAFGGDYGQAIASLLNFPSGVWGNSLGVVYIADSRNHRVRMVNSTGFITTFAGTGDQSYNGDDIPATSANIHFPTVVKGDTLGNIFITTGYCRIRVVSAIGIVGTIIGTGTCSPASTTEQLVVGSTIDDVYGLWIDSKGSIYFTEYNYGFVRMIFDGTPTALPTAIPSIAPSDSPSTAPTAAPSASPTEVPTESPTTTPSISPTELPTKTPTTTPSEIPSELPSEAPSTLPTANPSAVPSATPSEIPSVVPTEFPSDIPSVTPTYVPSEAPTQVPSMVPSIAPSLIPTAFPTAIPSLEPSETPSASPSVLPTASPSLAPTETLTLSPSAEPSIDPSATLTAVPTDSPSLFPSVSPSCFPTEAPSIDPTILPSKVPSFLPSQKPTMNPSKAPSAMPTVIPTFVSTLMPTVQTSLSSPSLVPSIATPSVSAPPTTMLYFSLTSNLSTWKEVISIFGVYSSNIEALSLLDVSIPSEGSSMIIFGSRDLPSGVINASMPAAMSHYPITCISPSFKRDKTSRSAVIPGDLNKDGHNDAVVCYPLTSSCSVFFGSGETGLIKVKVGATIYGPTSPTASPSSSPAATFFGFAVANAEDLNHDGYVDIIMSALRGKACYVVYGRPLWAKELKISAMKSGGKISDGADGYKIIADGTTTLTGLSVAGIGDMNGDGQRDLAISVQKGSTFIVYVIWGEGINAKDVSLSEVGDGVKGFRVFGEQDYYSGLSISRGGDINHDGLADLIIGAIPSAGRNLNPKSYLIFGKSQGSSFADILLGETASDGVVEIIGAGGFIVSGPGDLNNDGFDDIMITNVKTYIDKGNTYIVSYPGSMSSPPSLLPSSSPSSPPSNPPSSRPSSSYPTQIPSSKPPLFTSSSPSVFKASNETATPSLKPTPRPSRIPSLRPTEKPSSVAPSVILSVNPTRSPSQRPTLLQTKATLSPNKARARSASPSRMPVATRSPTSLLLASTAEFYSRSVNTSRASNQQNIIYGKDGENEIFEISSLSSDGRRRSGWSGTIIGGRGRKIYRLYPKDPNQPMNKIVLKDFDRSKDQLDVSHISQIRGKESLAFLTHPLTIILPDNQKILFSRYEKLQDLSGGNFVFQSTSTSSSSSSGQVFVPLDTSLLTAIIVVVIFVIASVGLMTGIVKVEIQKEQDEIKIEELEDNAAVSELLEEIVIKKEINEDDYASDDNETMEKVLNPVDSVQSFLVNERDLHHEDLTNDNAEERAEYEGDNYVGGGDGYDVRSDVERSITVESEGTLAGLFSSRESSKQWDLSSCDISELFGEEDV